MRALYASAFRVRIFMAKSNRIAPIRGPLGLISFQHAIQKAKPAGRQPTNQHTAQP